MHWILGADVTNETYVSDTRTAATIAQQTGPSTILATSGGRIIVRHDGITLPVASGYSVTVDLNRGLDLYTVERVFKRGGKVYPKGKQTHVYAEDLAEVVYRAGCYEDPFGEEVPA